MPLACHCTTRKARWPAQVHLQRAAEQSTGAHLPLGRGGVVACLNHEVLLAATHRLQPQVAGITGVDLQLLIAPCATVIVVETGRSGVGDAAMQA